MESMTSLLTQEQWDILDGMRSNLGLAADLAQAKISLILPLDRSAAGSSAHLRRNCRANEKRKQEETFAF